MKKILFMIAALLCFGTLAEAKRISEYSAVDALADADKFLISDTSASGREKSVTAAALKTYIGTDISFIAGSLADLKILTTAEPVDGEAIITATPSDKAKQTYRADTIDTLLSTAGSAPTIQSADPTGASTVGWYLATTSGDLFYVGANGLFTVAGAYAAWDTSPAAFSFTDETGIALNTAKVSDTKTVSGIDHASPISVTGDTGFGYKKNGSACTATAGTVVSGDEFNACVTSSGVNSTATTATVAIGGVTDVYSVTTLAAAAPTLSARAIGTNGTSLTLTGSESLSVGSGGSGGFDVDCSTAGSNITATYASGAPGTAIVYTLGTTVNSGDTCDLDYTQPGNGMESTSNGADLVSITSGAITNSSTQGSGISDNFSSDTSANYTRTHTSSGYLTVGSGTAGTGTWSTTYAYNNTSLGGANQDVSADLIYSSTVSDYSGVLARVDSSAKTGYRVTIASGRVYLNHFTGITSTYIAEYNGSYASGTYTARITTSGSTIKVYVDGVERISVTDSTYSAGNHCGLFFYRGAVNADVRADNLSGGLL